METKVEPAVHELRLGWSTDDTDMQLGKNFKHRSYCISRKYKVNIVLEIKSLNFPILFNLGESPCSFTYSGSAKKGTDCKFEEYGESFKKVNIDLS